MVQRSPAPVFDQRMVDRVILFLQTRDTSIFPFTARFDDARTRAFVRDLQDGLSDLPDSGSKRGTASVGFPTNDWRLREILDEWAMAGGEWPQGTRADSINSVLGLPDAPAPLEDEISIDAVVR
jgi:hypothetical protein